MTKPNNLMRRVLGGAGAILLASAVAGGVHIGYQVGEVSAKLDFMANHMEGRLSAIEAYIADRDRYYEDRLLWLERRASADRGRHP